MAQKWPNNDAQIYELFPQFFLTEKAVPQTFSLLECMVTGYSSELDELISSSKTGRVIWAKTNYNTDSDISEIKHVIPIEIYDISISVGITCFTWQWGSFDYVTGYFSQFQRNVFKNTIVVWL